MNSFLLLLLLELCLYQALSNVDIDGGSRIFHVENTCLSQTSSCEHELVILYEQNLNTGTISYALGVLGGEWQTHDNG